MIIFGYRCCQCGAQHSSVQGSRFRIVNGYKRRVCPICVAAEQQQKDAA